MKTFILWLEQKTTRPRLVVLLSTIFTFISITIILFLCALSGIALTSQIISLYMSLTGLVAGVYGFFTGTSSDKSSAVADKAADIMMDKLNRIQSTPADTTNSPSALSAKPE